MTGAWKETPFYRFALDPVFVASFIVMLVNDHLLRPHRLLPSLNWVISDFAIMIFLPAAGALLAVYAKFLAGLVLGKITPGRVMIPARLTMPVILGSIFVSAAVFILINVSPDFNGWYVRFINSINVLRPVIPALDSTSDAADLIALPSLAVSYLVLRRYTE